MGLQRVGHNRATDPFTFSTVVELLSASLALRASGQVISDSSILNPMDTFSLRQNKSKEEHTETCNNQTEKIKGKILKTTRKKQQITYKRTPISLPAYFSTETLKPERNGMIYLK